MNKSALCLYICRLFIFTLEFFNIWLIIQVYMYHLYELSWQSYLDNSRKAFSKDASRFLVRFNTEDSSKLSLGGSQMRRLHHERWRNYEWAFVIGRFCELDWNDFSGNEGAVSLPNIQHSRTSRAPNAITIESTVPTHYAIQCVGNMYLNELTRRLFTNMGYVTYNMRDIACGRF